MTSFYKALAIASLIIFTSSCASIVSKSSWPVSIQSDPAGASVSITNKKGTEIFSGKTPTAVKLKLGAGFFAKESYVVTISKDGYEPKKINLECKLNGWYFGNLLIGGLVGMLIVDPATGAMYKLDSDDVFQALDAKATNATTHSLQIMNKKDIPADMQQHLVRLK
jgi:hypothetical protein